MYIQEALGSSGPTLARALSRRQQGPPSVSNGTSPDDNSTQTGSSNNQSSSLSPYSIVVIVIVIIVILLSATLTIYSYLRRQRLQGKQPTYIPGTYLKQKWNSWKPRGKYASLDEQDSHAVDAPTGQVRAAGASVNRHTSVRSIISLPAYSKTPKEHEEVIAREGERGGIDTIVEFPETAEEEEGRREEEMESLYQIRQARRQEVADREERRRQRREAREAGDIARLDELRQESRQRREQPTLPELASRSSTTLTAEAMIAEHNARGRDRRVSSVSYAALGLARHDGSRIRSTSKGSEHGGLLSGAAPMGNVPPLPHYRNGSDGTSLLTFNDPSRNRYRDRSDSGAVSVSSLGSSFDNISSQELRPTTADTAGASHRTMHSASDSGSDESDIVDERVEPAAEAPGASPLPPQYEAIDWGDAPAYTEAERAARMSRILSVHDQITVPSNEAPRSASTAPQLPSLNLTPTITIQNPSIPNSPVVHH